jgi:hypothetical protein
MEVLVFRERGKNPDRLLCDYSYKPFLCVAVGMCRFDTLCRTYTRIYLLAYVLDCASGLPGLLDTHLVILRRRDNNFHC